MTLARTTTNETTGDLREQVASLREQLNEIVSRVDIERSNPLDTGAATNTDRQVPDASQQKYIADQQRLEAESEFRMQEVDPQWAIATENEIRERLTSSPDTGLQGDSADIASQVNSLECRSDTCRLEISEPDNEDLEAVQLRLLASTVGLFGKGTVHKTDTGGMIFYMHAEP